MTTPQAVNQEDETAFVKNFIRDIPPVTRVLFFGTLICTSLSLAGMLPGSLFQLDWRLIAYRFAVWTLIFSPLHAAQMGFGFLIHLYFLYTYSKQLEQNNFFGRSAAYAWMLVVCLLAILPLAFAFQIELLGPAVLMAIMHVWGRTAGETRVTLYGLVPIPAKYLSLAIIALNTILNGHLRMADVAGLVAGQVYYFLESVYPTLPNGRVVISVPGWFERFVAYLEDLGERALGGTSRQQVSGPRAGAAGYSTASRGSASGDRRPGFTAPRPRTGGSRHHWGSGRALGSS